LVVTDISVFHFLINIEVNLGLEHRYCRNVTAWTSSTAEQYSVFIFLYQHNVIAEVGVVQIEKLSIDLLPWSNALSVRNAIHKLCNTSHCKQKVKAHMKKTFFYKPSVLVISQHTISRIWSTYYLLEHSIQKKKLHRECASISVVLFMYWVLKVTDKSCLDPDTTNQL
jgi:hypothetical protein